MRISPASMIVVLALTAASACGGSKQDEFTMQDANAIRQRSQEFVNAFNEKKVDQVVDLYAENSVFMPPNQPVLRGKPALRDFYDELVHKVGATNLRLDVAEVVGHGPIAYQAGSFELEYKPAGGTPPGGRDRERGKYLFVLRSMSNVWRYEYTVWNSDLAPTASPAPAR